MSYKIKSFEEWKKRKRAIQNQDPQTIYEEIRNMVCVAFSTSDTDAVMQKVSDYGLSKYLQALVTLERVLTRN